MPTTLLFEFAAALLGLLLGSFANVVIYRLPRGESLLRPGSHCLACGHPVRWYDNVPVVSWLLLRGRCRDCGTSISWRYPAVELAMSLWFLLAFLFAHHAMLADFAAAGPAHTTELLVDGVGVSILGFLLIVLAVIDWQTQTLPDALTFTGMGVGFFLSCVRAAFLTTGEGDIHLTPRSNMRMQSPGSFAARGDVFLTGPEAIVLGRLLAILAASGLLLLIRASYKALRRREGIGLGDAKLLGMIAALLGFWDSMLAFFLGMIACSAYAVVLLVRGRATAATKLPLGSFLAAGGLVTALLGELVLSWYRGLL